MKKLVSRSAAVFFAVVMSPGFASDDVEMTSIDMGNGIYMIIGSGGNLGVSIGKDGVFLVDDQYAPLTPAIRKEIRRLAGNEAAIRFILNTHYHPDHTGGNENFGKAGSLVVAHDKVRERMSTKRFRESFLERGGESLLDALPVVTFSERASFHVNGETIRAVHHPRAHTDGDSVVFFKGANVVHMGDIYFEVGYPFIDVASGGSVDGLLAAVDDVLARSNAETKLISGHGKPGNRESLVEYRDMIRDVRNRVHKEMQAGKSLEDIHELDLAAEYDARWSWQFINGPRFVESVYRSLEQP